MVPEDGESGYKEVNKYHVTGHVLRGAIRKTILVQTKELYLNLNEIMNHGKASNRTQDSN